MLELIQAGGWVMLPILLCSITAITIVLERCWTLRREQVMPSALLLRLRSAEAWPRSASALSEIGASSPLGFVLASGLARMHLAQEEFQQQMRAARDQAIHELERYLTGLGVIAAICPLLGILGTVIGLIDVFDQLFVVGQAETQMLAGGISTALITSAAGLMVAIPALIAHRVLLRWVDEMILDIDAETSAFFERIRQQGTAS